MSENPPTNESELLELLRDVDLPAPQALHERIDAMVAEHAGGQRPGRRRWQLAGLSLPRGLAIGGALAVAAVVAIVIVIAGGGGGAPSLDLRQATALTLSPATIAAPQESSQHDGELTANVEGVSFPYWEDRFGWRATGARVDRIGGRTVETVQYENATGQRIGYMIVSGAAAPRVSGAGVTRWSDGVAFQLQTEKGTHVLTWLRDGHLCVVAGEGVDGATLIRLASWREAATASYY